jgi:hypothetical protein
MLLYAPAFAVAGGLCPFDPKRRQKKNVDVVNRGIVLIYVTFISVGSRSKAIPSNTFFSVLYEVDQSLGNLAV